jgi:hypothetical protein
MRKGVWHGLLTGLALLLAACGGGGQPQPDLTLAGISPQNPAVVQGETVTLTLTFTSQNGFQGPVSLSVTENGQSPSWLTLSPTSATLNVPKGGQAQVSLQVRVAGNAPTGPHALKLRASYGDKVAERDLTLTVNAPPDFAISLNPTSLTVQQGDSGTTQLTITPQNGFTGTVSLSLVAGQDQVPQGLTLSPDTVQVGTSSLTLSAQPTTPTGTYRLKVRATSGSLIREADLTVEVTPPPPPPSFTLSDPAPNPLSVQAGGTAAFQVTLASQNGFQGQVALSLADGQDPVPQGLSITATNPSPISLQAGGSVTVTATVSAGQGVAPGTYHLKVRAQGGSVVQEKPLSVQVGQPPSFDLSPVTPSAVTTSRDPSRRNSNTVSFTLTPQNGFQGQVNLSIVDEQGNPVPGLSLDPASVNVTGAQNFTVYVLADNNIPLSGAGKGYAVRLRASSGSIVREQPFTVDVWTRVGTANLNFQRVAYGNGIFVVAGQNGYDGHDRIYVYKPQDGSFTQVYDAPPDADCGWVRDVTYDPLHNAWVAAGYPAVVLRSTDNAQNWQIVYGARSPNYRSCSEQYPNEMQMEKVRFLNDRLMGWRGYGDVGHDKVYYSFDGGLTWNSTAIPTVPGYTEAIPQGITYGQGKFVAVGNLGNPNGPNGRFVAISTDGINWSTYPLSVPDTPWGKPLPSEVLYVPDWDRFVLAGEAGLVGISDDGLNWTFQFLADIGHLAGLAYGNGVVVAGSWSAPKVLVSADGQNWRMVETTCGNAAMSVAFGSGIFAHTSAGDLCTSP